MGAKIEVYELGFDMVLLDSGEKKKKDKTDTGQQLRHFNVRNDHFRSNTAGTNWWEHHKHLKHFVLIKRKKIYTSDEVLCWMS